MARMLDLDLDFSGELVGDISGSTGSDGFGVDSVFVGLLDSDEDGGLGEGGGGCRSKKVERKMGCWRLE